MISLIGIMGTLFNMAKDWFTFKFNHFVHVDRVALKVFTSVFV